MTRRNGATILAVEDEALNLRLLRAILGPAGYTLIEAESLAEARARIEEHVPDLVLLDLRLPDGDGLTFAREVKRRSATATVPVVAATASALAPTRQAAAEAGCDGFLVKPIRPAELLTEIRRHLDAAPSASWSRGG